MPLYVYEHEQPCGGACPDPVELVHGIADTPQRCPRCGGMIRKIVSRTACRRNVLASSNLREKGFTRLRRRDKGVYERD
jgi:hypothetical protein